ncbi:MAG: response regulator [Ferruginibacter sp.]
MSIISPYSKNILLAEDDEDDRFLFKHALDGLPLAFNLTIVADGEELMELLTKMKKEDLPDVLFLDLNMPRKSGFECLAEIKGIEKLDLLTIIVFSSSQAPDELEQFYNDRALYYIRKPDDEAKYKKVIYHALHLKKQKPIEQNL